MIDPLALRHGDYTAEISEVGATLGALTHAGRDLVFTVEAIVATPQYAGRVLAPWPNRIADGRYEHDSVAHQLPVNEVDRNNALHGLVLWERWVTTARTDDSVRLEHTVHPRPGYPFEIGLSVTYTLGGTGLGIELEAQNTGTDPAPVGLSVHPYLTVGDDRLLDEWSLEVPCAEVIAVDERLLPRATVPVTDLGLDHTTSRTLGDVQIDHAFTGVAFDDNGRATARLVGPDGSGLEVRWDRRCGWLQIYTLHVPGDPMHRRAVALEPMTCAPDAFNSGAGLVVLAPGARTSMGCSIAVTTGPTR